MRRLTMNLPKRLTQTVALFVLGFTSYFSAYSVAADESPVKAASSEEVASKLDPYFMALAEGNRLIATVALYKGDKQVYQSTLVPQGETTQLVEKELKYKIGSITKTFTAALIYQLVEAGDLSLETTLETYFPNIANADKITIKQMLNHHSGLYNYTDEPAFLSYHRSPQEKEFLIKKIESFEPNFEPGEKAAYSNSNYLLLGYIAEKVTGKPFEKLLKERVYQPLGMENTLLGQAINSENDEVFSYGWSGEQWEETPQWDMSVAYSAGALVSTAEDLKTFIRGLFQGKLIQQASLEQMIALSNGFGSGIFSTTYQLGDKKLQGYWHNGGIESFISHLAYYPEKDITVVVLTNGMNYDIRQLYETMLDAYFGQDVVVPEFGQAVELKQSVMLPLAGDYKSETHPLDITISVVGNTLYGQATGQGGFPLTALDENTFEFAKAGIEIRFDRENAQFEIKQGGRADIFIKVDDEGGQSVETLVVPVETLQQYVGLYQSDDFPLDIEVMLKGESLYAQATGQSAFPLTPISKKKFAFKLADIVIEFDVENGQLTITQRGVPHILMK
ncbi:serine hydrolase domain-containing protein [Kangiella marina]|uniref:Beta-lactamase-related domain-containing protein n=1 Tax=Kangiella marina TaxID=1079178 RepID=A0ABP8IJS1_9GAMM